MKTFRIIDYSPKPVQRVEAKKEKKRLKANREYLEALGLAHIIPIMEDVTDKRMRMEEEASRPVILCDDQKIKIIAKVIMREGREVIAAYKFVPGPLSKTAVETVFTDFHSLMRHILDVGFQDEKTKHPFLIDAIAAKKNTLLIATVEGRPEQGNTSTLEVVEAAGRALTFLVKVGNKKPEMFGSFWEAVMYLQPW